MKIAALAVLMLCLTGCSVWTEPATVTKLLEAQGYTHVTITGYRFWICGDDAFSTGFKAISPAGHPVSGAVCAGWVKGHTVRFDD